MFEEIVVLEYITCYRDLSTEQINQIYINTKLRESLESVPNGTIIGRPVSSSTTTNSESRIYYPFFSHINMPIKAGERAWVFDRSHLGRISYWLSRKVTDDTADDLNFTHDDRALSYLNLDNTSDRAEQNTRVFLDLGRSGVKLTSTRQNALSRSDFIGEPVVAVKSKSPDLSIQGSNNTAILLTNNGESKSATIEIVSGIATTDNQKTTINSDRNNEIIKPIRGSDSNTASAGTLTSEDKSRVTVSSFFNADSYYSLTGDDSGNQSTICLKTDGIRIVAKNDLKIIVGEGSDPSSIILKSDGNIIITPSSTGVIKLGGEDASAAILASPNAVQTSGTVTGVPIVSTAGGILGLEGQSATGVFSTKILVKV
jgi:hypothetical protein